ncbi:hypothetical protein MBLNU13_g07754t1 [Cladosporium sp. NU13]
MPFGRLSPVSESVSETDTESLYSARPVSGDLQPRHLNFSRPKPQDLPSSRNIQRDFHYAASTSSASSSTTAGSTRGAGAFYEPPSTHDYPTEPRFSDDSDQEVDGDSVAPSTRSGGSDLVWDNAAGELRSQQTGVRRNGDFDAQRYAAPTPRRPGNRSFLNDSVANDPELPQVPELPGDVPSPHIIAQQRQRQQQQKEKKQREQPRQNEAPKQKEDLKPTYGNFQIESVPRIVKSTSVEQQIERANSLSSIHTAQTAATQTSLGRVAGWEDSRSNHTPSESGDKKDWKSSEFDVSGLSEKKLAKLKKKGINPQLYMEMKAARGGKGKLVGPLVGNTYIG